MIQKKPSKFVSKLYNILEKQQTDAISWNEEGDAIEIRDIQELVKTVLSVHYKQTSFLSFSRQLNQYGFSKHRIGKKIYQFKHPFFKKNHKEEIINILSTHKIKSINTIQQQDQNDDNNLLHVNEQNSLASTIKKLQLQQKQICQQFSEQIQLQSQIKDIIIFLKKRIYMCDKTIDNYCFIAQLHLVKAMNMIPNDEQHQEDIEFIKQILQQFSNIYMEYNDELSQRSANISIRSKTPLPFYQYQAQNSSGFINQNNMQLKKNIANYLIWLQEWYQEALHLYNNLT